MKNNVVIKVYPLEYEAKLAQIKLEEKGIMSWILDKTDSTHMTSGEVDLYVLVEDKELALKTLDIDDMDEDK